MVLADFDRRRKHLDGIDLAELAQVADMVPGDAKVEPGSALRARPEAQAGEQVGRRLVAELGVELDVQMVAFIALPVFTAVLKVGIRPGLDTLRSLCVCGWLPQM